MFPVPHVPFAAYVPYVLAPYLYLYRIWCQPGTHFSLCKANHAKVRKQPKTIGSAAGFCIRIQNLTFPVLMVLMVCLWYSGAHSDIHSDAILMQISAAEHRSDEILIKF